MKVESQAPVATSEPEGGYREDQGRLARMFAFWVCVLLLLFGCSFLYGLLVQNASLAQPLGGTHVPMVGTPVSPAFLICGGIFVVVTWLIHRWQARPRVADLLIDTESELRKVTWPTMDEVINSSLVVIVCVLLLFAFLAAADWFLARVMDNLLLGKG